MVFGVLTLQFFAFSTQVIVNGKTDADLPSIVEQLMEDAEDELLRHEELAGASNSNFGLQFIQSVDGLPPIGRFSLPTNGRSGLIEAGALGDDSHLRTLHRVPANIERRNKDKFVLHIAESKLLTTAEDMDSVVTVVPGVEEFSVDTRPLDPVEEFLQGLGKSLKVSAT